MSDKQKKQNWREYVRRIDPYVPGEQPKERNIVKLNTNENPYPPSKRVEAVLRGLDPASLRLYPDPDASVLISAIAKHSGVDEDEVFAGVGSDDVLAMAFMTFFNSREPLLFPDISYSFYEVWADLFQVPFVHRFPTPECKAFSEILSFPLHLLYHILTFYAVLTMFLVCSRRHYHISVCFAITCLLCAVLP